MPRSRRRRATASRLGARQKSARKASPGDAGERLESLVTIRVQVPREAISSRPRTKRAMPSAATKKWARPREVSAFSLSAKKMMGMRTQAPQTLAAPGGERISTGRRASAAA